MLWLTGLACTLASAQSPQAEKVRLVFWVNQGFGNGLAVNNDAAAMRRIAGAIIKASPGVYPSSAPPSILLARVDGRQ